MNPSGRALKYASITPNCCHCLMTTNLAEAEEESQHFDIRPNGDIQICSTCDGCIVGNILEPEMSNELLTKRVKKLHDHFQRKYQVDRNTRMVDLCEICHKYRISDNGIKKSRSKN
jgi:hypothetical protein